MIWKQPDSLDVQELSGVSKDGNQLSSFQYTDAI